ncbi:hypothetical protein Tco_1221091 [Tanacetum coccineum]
MPRQNRSCAATPVPTDNQRGPEPQWEVVKRVTSIGHQKRNKLQATEAALVKATPAGSTQTEGGTDCIPVQLPRSY